MIFVKEKGHTFSDGSTWRSEAVGLCGNSGYRPGGRERTETLAIGGGGAGKRVTAANASIALRETATGGGAGVCAS